ncbi:MAG: putative metal-binding motif-containing protein [Patescibacteria group bacterium]
MKMTRYMFLTLVLFLLAACSQRGVPMIAEDTSDTGVVIDTDTDEDADLDGDHWVASDDCNDRNPYIHPGAAEICDGLDNDCDGLTDEGGVCGDADTDTDTDSDSDTDTDTDTDSDTDSDTGMGPVDSDGDGDPDSTDCADYDASRHHGAAEICNGLDDDCDGSVDEGLTSTTWYWDGDHDGYGTTAYTVTSCADPGNSWVSNDDDCDDDDATTYPGAPEICGDGFDNDCTIGADREMSVCYTTIYRFRDPLSQERCWGRNASYCPSSYVYEREAFVCGLSTFDGSKPLNQYRREVSGARDFLPLLSTDPDASALVSAGYTAQFLCYGWPLAQGPDVLPLLGGGRDLGECRVDRYRWINGVANGHLVSIGPDAKTNLVFEDSSFSVVTEWEENCDNPQYVP